MSYRPDASTFIVSNSSPPVNDFFHGYCFYDNDYIYGEEGVNQYRDAKGIEIGPGLDGCYVIITKKSDNFRISNDYSGYRVIYYYHDGETWAVSDSFAQIVDHLRALGYPLTPNYVHLAAVNSPGSAASQLFSFQTVALGIKVLPRATTLIITRHTARLERWDEFRPVNYHEGLLQHLRTWTSRFETLILDPRVDLTIDITGGVDSRTNFAIALVARRRLGKDGVAPRFNCGSTGSSIDDLKVAQQISEIFGVELNDERRFPGYRLTAHESFTTFRNLNAGVYYPIYMPIEGPSPHKIHVGGGGGEVHRRFYENHHGSPDPNQFCLSYARRLRYPWLAPEYMRDAKNAIAASCPPHANELRFHYREFRHRFHVGRAPRYGVVFTPLDSVSADLAQSRAGEERLNAGQLNYDILASLEQKLLEIPFDNPEKSPSREIRERLACVRLPGDPAPGKVWGPSCPATRAAANSPKARGALLKAAVQAATESSFVTDFWGADVVDRARDLAEKLSAGSGIGNAVNAKPISALLAAHLVEPR